MAFVDADIRPQFQIRYAPALAKKPTKAEGGKQAAKKPADPFAPPYIPNLFVAEADSTQLEDGEPSHVVLLNKFCVVPRHFLLVTKGAVVFFRSLACRLC